MLKIVMYIEMANMYKTSRLYTIHVKYVKYKGCFIPISKYRKLSLALFSVVCLSALCSQIY